MKFNFIGVAQNLLAVENTERSWTQLVLEDGVPATLAGVVFTLVIVGHDGTRTVRTLETAEEGAVLWVLPPLGCGAYAYELWAADADGTRQRMFYGALEVVPSTEVTAAAEPLSAPVMKTFLSTADGSLRWDWLAGAAAAWYAKHAAGSAAETQAAMERVMDALQAVPELRAFIAEFRAEIARAIRIEDGVWVIGDRVTGYPAQGPRGMNADEVQYHRISSVSQLPTDAEHCTPNHRYILEQHATHAMWSVAVSTMTASADRLINFGGLYVISAPENTSDFDNLAAWQDALNETVARDFIEVVDIAPVPDSSVIRVYFQAKAAGSAANNLYPTSSAFATDSVVTGADGAVTVYVWVNGAWGAFPLNAPLFATDVAHGLVLLGTGDTVPQGSALPVGNDAEGRLVADARHIPLPDATVDDAGVLTRAAAIEAGDSGAASGEQVAEALSGKQDRLNFDDPDSAVMAAIKAAAQQAVAEAGLGDAVGDVKINFSPVSPAGYLPMEGQRGLSRETYGALFAYFVQHGVVLGDGTPVADSGDGATTFDMPDISGCFMRFIGGGRMLDPQRTAGSFQAAAVPNITGSAYALDNVGTTSGAIFNDGSKLAAGGGTTVGNHRRHVFDASRVSAVYKNGVTEARPANLALYAYIKY